MSDYDRVGLAQLLHELRAAGYDGVSSYTRVYALAVSGIIPAHRKQVRGWEIDRNDFPVVAAALGLTRADQTASAA